MIGTKLLVNSFNDYTRIYPQSSW